MLTILTIASQAYVIIGGIVMIATVIETYLYDHKFRGDFMFACGAGFVIGLFWPVILYQSIKEFVRRF
jgi:hypothetical protein